MKRPEHLADYARPPLNEVVLGVQFAPPRGYQQIQAYEVWKLFEKQFPFVEEYPALMPTFETFGLPASPQINFGVVTGAQHDRFWFLSPGKEELIQFQQDKLLHNWRKVGDQTNEYPRFEKMLPRFEEELWALEKYFASLAQQKIEVNQCEISYINHIYTDEKTTISDVLRFANFDGNAPDDINFNFRRTILGEDGSPVGRVICEAQSGFNNNSRQQVLVLTITVRGAPVKPTIKEAVEFLKRGREVVVDTFSAITTDESQRDWGRLK